jgi:hypothetical protein
VSPVKITMEEIVRELGRRGDERQRSAWLEHGVESLSVTFKRITATTLQIRSARGELHDARFEIPGRVVIQYPLTEHRVAPWFPDLDGWLEVTATGPIVLDSHGEGGEQAEGWETNWEATIPLRHTLTRRTELFGIELFSRPIALR